MVKRTWRRWVKARAGSLAITSVVPEQFEGYGTPVRIRHREPAGLLRCRRKYPRLGRLEVKPISVNSPLAFPREIVSGGARIGNGAIEVLLAEGRTRCRVGRSLACH